MIRGAKSKRSYQAFKYVLHGLIANFIREITRRGKNPLPQLYIDSRRKRGVIFQSVAVIFQSKGRRDFRGKESQGSISILSSSRLPHCVPFLFLLQPSSSSSNRSIEFHNAGEQRTRILERKHERHILFFSICFCLLHQTSTYLVNEDVFSLLVMGSSCV